MVVHAIALVVAMRELGPASLTVAVAALSCPALLWGLIQLADLACMDKWVNASSKDDDP